MSFVKSVIPDDPFAALTWRACMANLALQKIRHGTPLDSEEREALTELFKDASDLATVMHQGVEVLLLKLDKRLIDLSRLVSSGVQVAGRELDLDQLGEDLYRVVEKLPFYPAVPMDDALLERTQETINRLIERANLFRPQPDRSPLIECVA